MRRTNQESLLSKIEAISRAATKSGLNFEEIQNVDSEIESIASFLEISKEQAVFFSCVVEISLQRVVTLDILSKHLKSSTIRIIDKFHELETLERKSLMLRCNRQQGKKFTYSDFGFIVPFNVIESLRTCDKELLRSRIQFNLPNLLNKISEMIHAREDNSLPTKDLLDQLELIILKNLKLPFIQYINRNVRQTVNKAIVFVLAYYSFKREDNVNIENITQAIFDDLSEQMDYEQNLYVKRNELFKKDIIRFQDTQFMNERVAALTLPVLRKLYKDYPELNFQNESENSLIKHRTIKIKSLFFDTRLQAQLDNLISVLDRKNFQIYQAKLESKNLPKGITAVFHGKSGTGKTESVFQIAKRTRRDIVMVELSELKSKWFGESERLIKKLFENYKSLSNRTTAIPILFINEADGMFSKRMELRGNSSVDQTINTIQNIILQELETFNGILFATTNLTVNLDKAFERRFLFKIEFNNPLPEISKKIWRSKLPDISENQSSILASKYSFSGGEIDNIARKYIIENIVSAIPVDFDKLIEYCEAERPFQKIGKIGFNKGA